MALGAGIFAAFLIGAVEARVNCQSPGPRQPKYCCTTASTVAGMHEIVKEYHEDCKCNPDWSQEECTCRGITFKTLCHHCMVNLPASNQMTTEYSYDELYARCDECMDKCEAEEVPEMCSSYFGQWKEEQFVSGDYKDIMCSRDQLQKVLFTDSYPDVMKKALYRKKSMRSDNDIWMDSDWPVPGAMTHEAVFKELKKKAAESTVFMQQNMTSREATFVMEEVEKTQRELVRKTRRQRRSLLQKGQSSFVRGAVTSTMSFGEERKTWS